MRRLTLFATTAMLIVLPIGDAVAQDATNPDVTRRIDRIERELRAVQRRVFPGAQDGLFQPELQPADAGATPGVSTTSPVADLTARVDAIEAQLTRLTEQVEQTGFRQREMEATIARLRTELTGRLDRIEAGTVPTSAAPTPAPTTPIAVTPPRPTPSPTPAPRPTPAPTPTPSPSPAPRPTTSATTPVAASANTAERRARVAAIEVPATGNDAEDAYIYGYRLWEADLYPEAQVQLQKVLDTFPNHRRASYAGNLLGRAFLDNSQPTQAVRAFYDNYRTRPRGERAPDSVYFMGMALIQLNRRTDACQTFDEFTRVYGATASEDLRNRVATARGTAGCAS